MTIGYWKAFNYWRKPSLNGSDSHLLNPGVQLQTGCGNYWARVWWEERKFSVEPYM